MKKTIIAVLILTVALGLCACGSETEKKETAETPVAATVSETQNNAAETAKSAEDETAAATSIDWETFLKEYEAWVDKYAAVVEKYKANPTDISLLSDYTKLAEEMTEWSEKADDVQVELENNPKALQEYLKTLGRITEKLTGIAY